jgi:hypothetical protein
MGHKKPEKEANLKEVLAEVSLVDVGRSIKSGLALMGCYLLFLLVVAAVAAFGHNSGYDVSLGVPSWVIWLGLAWMYVYSATSSTSYHAFNGGWYFPKLGWFSSLVFASYLVGFVYLNRWVWDMELGVERGAAAALVWVIYPAPFLLFLAVIRIGHDKLMEKRSAQQKAGQAGSEREPPPY